MTPEEQAAIRTDLLLDREPPRVPRDGADAARAREFAIEAAQVLRDDKCEQLVVLDVRMVSPITDYIVIGTGTSDRQMDSALRDVGELGEMRNMPAPRTSRDDNSTWLLGDHIDVVVHLFEPNARALYDLELLWGDAPRVEVPDGPGPLAIKRAGGGADG